MEILETWAKFHFCIDCIYLDSACAECPSLSQKLKFVFLVLFFSIESAGVHKDVSMCGSNINASFVQLYCVSHMKYYRSSSCSYWALLNNLRVK